MDVNYILSVCQCVINDLFIHGLHFHYVSDSACHNDYHDMRNSCRCNSGKLHHYGLLYCLKHLEVLQKLFSYDVCRRATRFCSHKSGAACKDCYHYFKYFYLEDAIKICISPSSNNKLTQNITYFPYSRLYGFIEVHYFFQNCRKIRDNENEQVS